jgi:hypothetical protein
MIRPNESSKMANAISEMDVELETRAFGASDKQRNALCMATTVSTFSALAKYQGEIRPKQSLFAKHYSGGSKIKHFHVRFSL